MRHLKLLALPAWIPLSVSWGLGIFVLSRGLDYLNPQGNSAPYLDGLNRFGFRNWGIALVVLAVVLFLTSLLRLARHVFPLFVAHMACVFVYGVLFVAIATGEPSWVWFRALLNVTAAALMHVARAVSLFLERPAELLEASRGSN